MPWSKPSTQTDKEIDAMVYKLYGLMDDEIKVVEKNLSYVLPAIQYQPKAVLTPIKKQLYN